MEDALSDTSRRLSEVDPLSPDDQVVPPTLPPVEARTYGAYRFADRVCLVTGAATGIGQAVAVRLWAEGATVVAADINLDLVRQTVALGGAGRRRALAARLDVRSDRSVASLARRVERRFGRLDVLVNNAGIHFKGDILETDPDTWDDIFAVNLRGIYLMCRTFLPMLLRSAADSGEATIVNTASLVGLIAAPRLLAYSASKAGVIHLTRSLAIDHATAGLRVNCVCPGTVHTPMLERLFAREDDRQAAYSRACRQHPVGYIGRPDDVAAAITYLASREARFVTGAVLTVDGGRSTI